MSTICASSYRDGGCGHQFLKCVEKCRCSHRSGRFGVRAVVSGNNWLWHPRILKYITNIISPLNVYWILTAPVIHTEKYVLQPCET